MENRIHISHTFALYFDCKLPLLSLFWPETADEIDHWTLRNAHATNHIIKIGYMYFMIALLNGHDRALSENRTTRMNEKLNEYPSLNGMEANISEIELKIVSHS